MEPIIATITHHVAISVRNLRDTMEFYSIFGFRLLLRWDAPDNSLSIVHLAGPDGIILEVFQYASNADLPEAEFEAGNDLERIGFKHFGLKVIDIRMIHRLMSDKFGKRVGDIQRGRTGIDYFFTRDPDGMWVEIVQDDRQLNVTNPTFLS